MLLAGFIGFSSYAGTYLPYKNNLRKSYGKNKNSFKSCMILLLLASLWVEVAWMGVAQGVMVRHSKCMI